MSRGDLQHCAAHPAAAWGWTRPAPTNAGTGDLAAASGPAEWFWRQLVRFGSGCCGIDPLHSTNRVVDIHRLLIRLVDKVLQRGCATALGNISSFLGCSASCTVFALSSTRWLLHSLVSVALFSRLPLKDCTSAGPQRESPHRSHVAARLLITSHCGVSAMALVAGMNRRRFPHEGCFTCRRLVDGRCQAPRLRPASRL
jgi:hypothetical protein